MQSKRESYGFQSLSCSPSRVIRSRISTATIPTINGNPDP